MQWNLPGTGPVYLQLAYAIKTAIARGELAPSVRLAGVREMAAEAAVNPNTMQRAMALLQEEGLIVTERTAGSFVTDDRDKIADTAERLGLGMAENYLSSLRLIGREDEAVVFLNKVKEEKDG